MTTHEDYLHPPLNGWWYLPPVHNTDLGSFLCYLKYLTLRGDQVVNLCYLCNDLSITLSAHASTNIEVLPSFLYLYISSNLNVLILPPIDHRIHSPCLQTYISFEGSPHSIITNGVSVKSYLYPWRHCIFGQNSSLTCGW